MLVGWMVHLLLISLVRRMLYAWSFWANLFSASRWFFPEASTLNEHVRIGYKGAAWESGSVPRTQVLESFFPIWVMVMASENCQPPVNSWKSIIIYLPFSRQKLRRYRDLEDVMTSAQLFRFISCFFFGFDISLVGWYESEELVN